MCTRIKISLECRSESAGKLGIPDAQDGHRGLHGELNRPALGVVVVENTRFRCIVWRDDLGFLSLSLEKDFFLSDSTRAERRVARCTFSQQLYVFHTPSLPKRFSVHHVFTF